MDEQYILDTSPEEEAGSALSEKDKELVTEFEALAKKCLDEGVPCFISAKIDSHADPVAAWNFGSEPAVAHKTFVDHFAPLMLHMVASMTGLRVVAINPKTGGEVYATGPDVEVTLTDTE
jgi:hypothetical protein